jgi:hypothetical protein
MCFVWISEQTAIVSLYSINWLVCITDTEYVYCAVRNVSWNIIQVTFVFKGLIITDFDVTEASTTELTGGVFQQGVSNVSKHKHLHSTKLNHCFGRYPSPSGFDATVSRERDLFSSSGGGGGSCEGKK